MSPYAENDLCTSRHLRTAPVVTHCAARGARAQQHTQLLDRTSAAAAAAAVVARVYSDIQVVQEAVDYKNTLLQAYTRG